MEIIRIQIRVAIGEVAVDDMDRHSTVFGQVGCDEDVTIKEALDSG
jgi:hypothetical protein